MYMLPSIYMIYEDGDIEKFAAHCSTLKIEIVTSLLFYVFVIMFIMDEMTKLMMIDWRRQIVNIAR